MRAMFRGKFQGVSSQMVIHNSSMIRQGAHLYTSFISEMTRLTELDDKYRSIPVLYKDLGLEPNIPASKRKLYEHYSSGIVAGAGSGDDCIDLVGKSDWLLFDFEDDRMIRKGLGHSEGTADVAILSTPDGSTIGEVKKDYVKSYESIDIITIDSLNVQNCGVISADVEGSGFDALVGAASTIQRLKPDILMSIYHHWVEYLMVIPYLYEMGYTIDIVRTINMLPTQPHLELTVKARFMK